MTELNKIITKFIKETDSDLYLFSASINMMTADAFIKKLGDNKNKKENCSLILTTFGGEPDAGYRVIRAIKRYYKKLILYVFGTCKSTGTLIALGADEIVMGDFAEFGPLDIQLTKDDELSSTSGLNFIQSLLSINEQLFSSFEKSFLTLKRKSRYTITTKTAAEIATKLTVGLISPISAQIDPIKLGEVYRAMKIAEYYGKRISKEDELITKLIIGYPSHGFVIDFKEAKEIFVNVRSPNDIELTLEELLFNFVRYETEDGIVLQLVPEIINKKSEKNINKGKVVLQTETTYHNKK